MGTVFLSLCCFFSTLRAVSCPKQCRNELILIKSQRSHVLYWILALELKQWGNIEIWSLNWKPNKRKCSIRASHGKSGNKANLVLSGIKFSSRLTLLAQSSARRAFIAEMTTSRTVSRKRNDENIAAFYIGDTKNYQRINSRK